MTQSNLRMTLASSPVISGVVQVGLFLLCKLDFSDTAAGKIPRAGLTRGVAEKSIG